MRSSFFRLAIAIAIIGLICSSCILLQRDRARLVPTAKAAVPAKSSGVVRPQQRLATINCTHSANTLDKKIKSLAERFNGRVGIAIMQAGCDWIAGHDAQKYFPQQSVSKLWVSLAVFDNIDKGRLKLDSVVRIGPGDLTVLNQPIRQEVLARGSANRSLRQLVREALSLSDNTANDQLLKQAGGPQAIRLMLERKRITGIRFGPGERLLQSSIAGLTWQPVYSTGQNFYLARAALPAHVRAKALDSYLADPIDGAKPEAIVRALTALAEGRLLSPLSTRYLLSELSKTRSGPRRLKGGVPSGWTVYHKTGTGQELGRRATGYNDVGLLRSPSGQIFAIAVMIGETREPIASRMHLMQAVAREVVRFHSLK